MQTLYMFRLGMAVVLFSGVVWSAKGQVKIGNNPTNINSSALLELENRPGQSRGMIFPRVSLPRTDQSTMGVGGQTAVQGMVVYNTNASVIGTTTYPASGVGIYSFDGTGWVYGGIPSGGSTGQVLSKTTTGLAWGTPASGVVTYTLPGTTSGTGLVVTATGPGVTYSVSTALQTVTVNVPVGVRLISLRSIETATSTGVNSSAPILKFVIQTDPADNLNTSFLNATIPQVQFFNYALNPKTFTGRVIRFDSAIDNKLTVSITAMDTFTQFLFLFNF